MPDTGADIEAIRRVLAQYCHLCDDGRFDEWAELYAADATFSVLGRTYTGPAEIKGFIEKGQPPERRGKHMCANALIDLEPDGQHAKGVTDYVFVGRTDEGVELTSVGRYHDTFVRDGEQWRFQSRAIVFMGDQPLPG